MILIVSRFRTTFIPFWLIDSLVVWVNFRAMDEFQAFEKHFEGWSTEIEMFYIFFDIERVMQIVMLCEAYGYDTSSWLL